MRTATAAAAFQPPSEAFIVEDHRILWVSWETARDYAQCRTVLFGRKQSIKAYEVKGVRYWHVRSEAAILSAGRS